MKWRGEEKKEKKQKERKKVTRTQEGFGQRDKTSEGV